MSALFVKVLLKEKLQRTKVVTRNIKQAITSNLINRIKKAKTICSNTLFSKSKKYIITLIGKVIKIYLSNCFNFLCN